MHPTMSPLSWDPERAQYYYWDAQAGEFVYRSHDFYHHAHYEKNHDELTSDDDLEVNDERITLKFVHIFERGMTNLNKN